jgi:hypothetical protein
VGTCCGGTGLENHTKYQDSIYFRSVDDSTLYVNLYIASTLEWQEKGFTITQATQFPLEGASTLTIEGSGPLDIKLRVPTWVRKGYTVSINGEVQAVDPVPGTYLSLSRLWSPGDRVEIGMPFSFRAERAIDDPLVQSIYYGPTLMAVQSEPVGEDLESGLIDVSLYRHVKLDGDLVGAMIPSDEPLHFTTNGLDLVPFYIADPAPPGSEPSEPEATLTQGRFRRGPPTQPYHLYVGRNEPDIVFGSMDSGVANASGPDGLTFLDAVWERAPFEDHGQFLSAVEQMAAEWEGSGVLTEADGAAVLDAARRAEADLRV